MTERKENGEEDSVYYKDDEHRFSQQYTVKLKTFSEYNIEIEVSPQRELMYFTVGSRKYKRFNRSDNSQDKDVYTFVWSTKMIRTTERKHRSVLPFSVKFCGNREVNFNMFVKFYYSCEVAHYNGTPLTFIELNSGCENDKEEGWEIRRGGG